MEIFSQQLAEVKLICTALSMVGVMTQDRIPVWACGKFQIQLLVPSRWDDQTPAPNPGKSWPICVDNQEFALIKYKFLVFFCVCVFFSPQEISKSSQV